MKYIACNNCCESREWGCKYLLKNIYFYIYVVKYQYHNSADFVYNCVRNNNYVYNKGQCYYCRYSLRLEKDCWAILLSPKWESNMQHFGPSCSKGEWFKIKSAVYFAMMSSTTFVQNLFKMKPSFPNLYNFWTKNLKQPLPSWSL